jgi:hypothetical protein
VRWQATWLEFSACVRAGPRWFAGKAELTGWPHSAAMENGRTKKRLGVLMGWPEFCPNRDSFFYSKGHGALVSSIVPKVSFSGSSKNEKMNSLLELFAPRHPLLRHFLEAPPRA